MTSTSVTATNSVQSARPHRRTTKSVFYTQYKSIIMMCFIEYIYVCEKNTCASFPNVYLSRSSRGDVQGDSDVRHNIIIIIITSWRGVLYLVSTASYTAKSIVYEYCIVLVWNTAPPHLLITTKIHVHPRPRERNISL